MTPIRWLLLAARVLLAEIADRIRGRRDPHPWDAEKVREAVRRSVKARDGRLG